MRSTLASLLLLSLVAVSPPAVGAEDDEDCEKLTDANRKVICEYDRKHKPQELEWKAQLAEVNQAIALKGDDANSYLRRAELYGHLGEPEKELADLSRAIELNPNDYRPYFNRALFYDINDQADLAIADYDKLITLRPDDAYIKTRRAAVLSKAGGSPAAAKSEATAAPPVAGEPAPEPGPAGEGDCRRFDALVNEIVSVPCPQ